MLLCMLLETIMKKNDKQTEAVGSKHDKSRRQLDFEKKKKSGCLSKKVFYLDIKDARRLRNLEGKLKQLGGTIEKFLSKEVNYIITSNANLSKQKMDRQGGTVEGPNTPSASTPSPFNLGQSPSPSSIAELKKIENIPRGKTLAKIAGGQQSPNTVLENAEKIGIKVVSYEQTIKYVEKEIAKLKVLPETSKQATTKKPSGSRNKVQMLKAPFIKFEAENCHYRPVVQELETWPHLNVETPSGTCPFDGRPLTHARCSERAERDVNAERILSPDNPKGPGLDTPNTPQDEGKRTCGKVNEDSTSKLLGFPILTAGELRRERERKRRVTRRQGYCEACKEKYMDIDKHLVGEHHKQFVRNKANFMKLDQLIESGPSTATFISSVILRHCVIKAQEKPKSQGSEMKLECETTPTDESDFKMAQMQTPKKKSGALNMKQNQYDAGDNVTEHCKTFKDSIQPLQMIEMSQICPKHKKDRSLCRCTDVLSSLGRQLAQSCSPNHTVQRHTKQVNELRNVNFRSGAVVKNTSCRGLYGSPSRLSLRKCYQQSSKHAMVIGSSQIASLQTLRNVCNSDSNIHVNSNIDSSEDGDMSDNHVPQNEVRHITETTKTETSVSHECVIKDSTKCLTEDTGIQPKDDCVLKSQAKSDQIQTSCNSSSQNVIRESVDDSNKKSFIAKTKFMPLSLKSSKVQSSSHTSSNINIHSSNVLQRNENEHSLQTADFTAVNKEKQECKSGEINETSLKQSLANQSLLEQTILNEKLNSEGGRTTTVVDDVESSPKHSKSTGKAKSVNCNKVDSVYRDNEICQSHELLLQEHTNKKPVTNHMVFYESAAERVKTRRAKPSSVAGSNTPTGSVCEVSQNDRSSQLLKNKNVKKANVKVRKLKCRHWSGSSYKYLKENDLTSSMNANPVKFSRKKHLRRLHLGEAQDNIDSKVNDIQNISSAVNASKVLKEESHEILAGSLSPKYKTNSNHCNHEISKKEDDINNVTDNEEIISRLSDSTSPVFKKSPRYCKKTNVPISPVSFSSNATKDARKKGNEKMKDITKYSGFLRTPASSVRSIKFKGNKDSLKHVKQFDSGVQVNAKLLLTPNKKPLNEESDLDPDSPKSGFSTTPSGVRYARRKVYSVDDTLNSSKGHKRNKLKLSKNIFEDTKTSVERLEEPENQKTDGLASENPSCKTSRRKNDPSEACEKINVLSPIQANNCVRAENAALDGSAVENGNREVLRKSKKRKWSDVHTSWSKHGSSSKKVRLSRSWRVLSERSMSRLLESEADPPSFHGYNRQLAEARLPSDLTYEELSEVELSDNSEKEWILEDCSNRNNTKTADFKPDDSFQEESFNELLPLFSSPGKMTDSSWGDACDNFLKSACEKHSLSTPYDKQQKKKSVRADKNSSRSKLEKQKDKTDFEGGVQMPNCFDLKTPPKHKRSQKRIGFNDVGVKQVDEDIVFNFCSPQKDKRQFSPLRKEDVYVCLNNRYDVSSRTPSQVEQNSPKKHKNKHHKRRQHSDKNTSKLKKSVYADLEDIKRTSSKFKKERFS